MQLKILFYGTVKKQNKVLRQAYHTEDFNVIQDCEINNRPIVAVQFGKEMAIYKPGPKQK